MQYVTQFPSRLLLQELGSCWDGQPFGHNRHEPKSGGCCALFHAGAGSPSNTMWPWPRPTSTLSDILIHPTVWPQYTNVTDRQDIQDRQTGQRGQRSRSTGRTVTCSGRL